MDKTVTLTQLIGPDDSELEGPSQDSSPISNRVSLSPQSCSKEGVSLATTPEGTINIPIELEPEPDNSQTTAKTVLRRSSRLVSKSTPKTPKSLASTLRGKFRLTRAKGSSILRGFDSEKLNNTEVDCIRGGGTLMMSIRNSPKIYKYSRVVLQIDSNDCSSDKPAKDIVSDYQLLIKGDKNVAEETIVSSICPRFDKPDVQKKIDSVNAELQVLCGDEKVTFINNDTQGFKFQDGCVNEGYIWGDKIHLSKPGIEQTGQKNVTRLQNG
ncbi:unnamed protein product [Owenia fusiformis]|uniref:Uncharacterized protein n=1 Tax=Owenia fusiformis TaxID=6347 RepID=A0A8S4PY62_OWEFU|nr:unnamed protein product [Owenia fusiformis]